VEQTELEELKKEVTELKTKVSFLLGFVKGLKKGYEKSTFNHSSSIVSASEYAEGGEGHLMTKDEAIRTQSGE
jgi:hypothetical protein